MPFDNNAQQLFGQLNDANGNPFGQQQEDDPPQANPPNTVKAKCKNCLAYMRLPIHATEDGIGCGRCGGEAYIILNMR